MQTLLLDLFASIALTCAMGVIVSTNSIHSVIFLILVFCNATGLLLLLSTRAEFIAIMFLIIYVGAIAVLFLFVVMMLNVREGGSGHQRLVVAVAAVTAALLCFSAVAPFGGPLPAEEFSSSAYIFLLPMLSNTQMLGYLIYTYYFYFLIMAGLILLVAMIGAIVLTMHKRKNASKKQFIFEQVARRFEDAIYFAA